MLSVASGACADSITPLLLRAQRGCPHAMRELVDQYRPLLRSQARKLSPLPGGHSLEDLEAIGETCLWKLVQRWDASRGAWGALAKSGLRNCLLNELARQTRRSRGGGQAPLPLDEWQDERESGGDAAALATDRLHAQQVRDAARALVTDPVDALLLRSIMEETPLSELAAAAGMTPQGLSYRRASLLRRLKEQLGHLN
jgi:RNA polymerase sigma factor (sigma-70 family)